MKCVEPISTIKMSNIVGILSLYALKGLEKILGQFDWHNCGEYIQDHTYLCNGLSILTAKVLVEWKKVISRMNWPIIFNSN